jgi:TRAP-type C4-dicarboxylate transport system permease large subunit
MEMTGIARVMVAFLAALVGHVRGGLSYVLLGAMYLVSGISGSKAADMAAVAPVLFPEMRDQCIDHSAVHRRAAACSRGSRRAGGDELVPLSPQ